MPSEIAWGSGWSEELPGGARLVTASDEAVLVRFPGGLSETVHQQVRYLAARLGKSRPTGVREWVPAYDTVYILHEPTAGARSALRDFLERVLSGEEQRDAAAEAGRLVEVPTRYGGADGPDLEEVGRLCGLSPEEVVRLHSGTVYRCYLLGFMPGFPYLGRLPEALRIARLPSPRTRVPGGSVAIAGGQTGIYPLDSPGGWRIIGRTDLRLFDPQREEPFLIRPGDRVRFCPIGGGTG